MNKTKYFFGLLLVLWFIVSIIVSIMPSQSIPVDYIFGHDKLLHAIKFIFFSVILYNFLHYCNWNYAQKLMLYIPLQFYPILDEAIQLKVPSRSYSAYDILANYIGVLIGLIISIFIRIYIHKKRVI